MVIPRKTLIVFILINAVTAILMTWRGHITPDFRSYYIAGIAARQHPASVYDYRTQIDMQQEVFGDHAIIPFLHPPLELPLFALLSRLPYLAALVLWEIVNGALAVISAKLLAQSLELKTIDVMLLLFALAPTMQAFLEGQDDFLLLFLIVVVFCFLRKDRDILAGVVMSLALFKFQLPVVLALAMLVFGRRRFVAAFAIAGSAVTGLSLLYLQRDGIHKLLEGARFGEDRPFMWQMPNFRGVLASTIGDHQLLATIIFLVTLAIFGVIWRRSITMEQCFGSGVCVACFASPHVFTYDLIVLVIPLTLALRASARKSEMIALVLLTSGPLFIVATALKVICAMVIPSLLLCYGLSVSRRPELHTRGISAVS